MRITYGRGSKKKTPFKFFLNVDNQFPINYFVHVNQLMQPTLLANHFGSIWSAGEQSSPAQLREVRRKHGSPKGEVRAMK